MNPTPAAAKPGPSAAKLRAADAKTRQAVPPAQHSSEGRFDCPDRDGPRPKKPCDVTSLTLTITGAAAPTTRAKPEDSVPLAKRPKKDAPRVVRVISAGDPAATHEPDETGPWASGRVLKLIGSAHDSGAPTFVQVDAASDCGFCGAKHPLIQVTNQGVTRSYPSPSQKVHVWRAPLESTIAQADTLTAVLYAFWIKGAPPEVFTIVAQSHAFRLDGKPAVGVLGVDVQVYPDESFSLQLKIPAFAKKDYSYEKAVKWKMSPDGVRRFMHGTEKSSGFRKLVDETSKTESHLQSFGGDKVKLDSSSETVARRLGGLNAAERTIEKTRTQTPDFITRTSVRTESLAGGEEERTAKGQEINRNTNDAKPVEVEERAKLISLAEDGLEFNLVRVRDGEQNKIEVNVLKLAKGAADLYRRTKDLWNKINDFVPQIGWKFTFEMSFLSGTVEAMWKRAITPEGELYTAFSIEAELELMDVTITFSFGFKATKLGLTFELIAEGKLRGTGKVSGGGSWEAPGESAFKLGGEATAIATAEVRGTAGSPHFARVSGKATTSLVIRLSLKDEKEHAVRPQWGADSQGVVIDTVWTVIGWANEPSKYVAVNPSVLRPYGPF